MGRGRLTNGRRASAHSFSPRSASRSESATSHVGGLDLTTCREPSGPPPKTHRGCSPPCAAGSTISPTVTDRTSEDQDGAADPDRKPLDQLLHQSFPCGEVRSVEDADVISRPRARVKLCPRHGHPVSSPARAGGRLGASPARRSVSAGSIRPLASYRVPTWTAPPRASCLPASPSRRHSQWPLERLCLPCSRASPPRSAARDFISSEIGPNFSSSSVVEGAKIPLRSQPPHRRAPGRGDCVQPCP